MKKIYFIIIIFLVALALVFVKSTDLNNTRGENRQNVSIRLKWLNQAQFAGLYVAKEKKFYDKYNLSVDLRERNFKVSSVDELVKGKVDFVIITPQELITSISEGKNLIAVASFFQHSPAVIVSLEDSGIKTPKDFLGKSLGIVSDTDEAKFIYRDLMAQYGLTDRDIVFKVVGANQVEDLINNSVDAVLLYRTGGYQGLSNRGLRYNFILPEEYGTIIYDDILVTTKKYSEDNPDLVKRFVKATMEGWEDVFEKPEEAVDICVKYSNKEYKNRNYQSDILYQTIQLMKSSDIKTIGQMEDLKWKIIMNKLDAHGLLKNKVKTDEIYSNKFLLGEKE